jgi:uncharacterized membrane protein
MVDTASEWFFVLMTVLVGIVLAVCVIPFLFFKILICLIKGRFYDRVL